MSRNLCLRLGGAQLSEFKQCNSSAPEALAATGTIATKK